MLEPLFYRVLGRVLLLVAILLFAVYGISAERESNPSIFLVTNPEMTYTATAFELNTRKGKLTITNHHVCQNGTALIGMMQDGTGRLLVVRKVYDKHDLCILTPTWGLPPLQMADLYIPGEMATVEGFPRSEHAITTGIVGGYFVSNFKSDFTRDRVFAEYHGFVDHGSSGSPVMNSHGDVIGVISVVGISAEGESVGGFVPLEFLKDFIDSL